MIIVPRRSLVPGIRRRRPRDFMHRCAFSGQGNALSQLTINGTTVDAATSGFLYLASDINTGTGAWAEHHAQAGGALTLQAGTPTYDVNVATGVGGGADEGVTGDGTAYWQPAGTTFGNFDTDDFAVEVVALAFAPVKFMLAKRDPDGGANDHGWGFGIYAGNVPTFHFEDSSANGCTLSFPAVTVGALYHWLIVADRSGNAIGWQNAAAISAVNCSSVGSTDVAKALTIMAASGGNYISSGTIVSAAAWHAAGWLDTHLQADLAAERHARWTGLLANLSRYGDAYPTITRSTTAYITRNHTAGDKLHLLGAGMAALEDPASDAGGRIEGGATNLVTYNRAINSWATKANVTVTDNDTTGPSGVTDASLITESSDGSPVAHYPSTTVTTTAQRYAVSARAKFKPSGRSWFKIQASGSTAAQLWCDCENGVTGTTSGADFVSGHVEGPDAEGFYRFIMVMDAGAGACAIYLISGDADNSAIYQGDGRDMCWLTRVQVEAGDATSDIDTAGAPVTRNALVLRRDVIATEAEQAGEGTLIAEFTLPALSNPSVDRYVWTLSDGGAAADQITLWVDASAKKMTLTSAATGGNAGSCVPNLDPYSGNKIRCTASWRHNHLSLLVEDLGAGTSAEAVDTSVDIPDDLDQFQEGADRSAGNQLNAPLQRLEYFPYARR